MNEAHVNDAFESAPAPAAGQGLPLRGLAMILIAVAVCLAMWSLYSFTQLGRGGSTQSQGAAQPTAVAAPTTDAAAADAAGTGTPGATPAAPASQEAPAASSAQASAAAASGEVVVNVLNNSTVQGLAAQEAQVVQGAGYRVGEVGNFSDAVLGQTTVFYPAGNAAAEAKAREVAARYGAVVQENLPTLPGNVTGNNGVTLVLVGQ